MVSIVGDGATVMVALAVGEQPVDNNGTISKTATNKNIPIFFITNSPLKLTQLAALNLQ
jgi:hypothetical protein